MDQLNRAFKRNRCFDGNKPRFRGDNPIDADSPTTVTELQSDADLISRYYSAADDQALAQFVQKHRSWAIQRARHYVSQDEAEDVVQASIIRLMSAKPIGGRVNNPLGWWHTVISATAKDLIRESSRRTNREHAYTTDVSPSSTTQANGRESDLVDAVFDEIRQTDIRFRDPLLKRYFEDLSYEEIARELNLRPGTVASRLARGIERVRAALESKGVYVPTQPSETEHMNSDATMSTDVASMVGRWQDVWFVTMHDKVRGIGHLSVSEGKNDLVTLRNRLDMALENAPENDPRNSPNRLWFEYELSIEDIQTLRWSSFRTKEGATDSANALMAERGMHYDSDELIECVENGSKLVIHSGSDTKTMEVTGDGPLVPDVSAAFYICQLPRDASTAKPIRIIGFERSLEGRRWAVAPAEVRYAGCSGPPVGLSHTFEIDLKAAIGRNHYVWVDDDGTFIGMGDERESFITVENEAAALAMFARH
ncbi:MAG: RNA polymerase sigma factor [Gammaproteobacteria bacterium]|nr:RNA polymerase sigma factor [Gammaproteobacteria bacterium]